MINNISFLIHGPYNDNILHLFVNKIIPFKQLIKKIVFVIYIKDKEKYLSLIEQYFSSYNVKTVFIKDLLNPGFANINRQIYSIKNGIKLFDDEEFIIKLRNDQSFSLKKLLNFIHKNKIFKDINDHKILTTCSFSRKDRYYHPSDMFLCAYAKYIKMYYDIELINSTELDMKLYVRELYEKSNYTLKASPLSPEIILFKNFISKKGWVIKDTIEDSYMALKNNTYIVNTWNIDLIWSKNRTFLFGNNKIILPHYFTISPFKYAPIEKHSCWLEHEFFGKSPSLKDIFYIYLSKFIWYIWPNNLEGFFKNRELNNNKISFHKLLFSLNKEGEKIVVLILGIKITLKQSKAKQSKAKQSKAKQSKAIICQDNILYSNTNNNIKIKNYNLCYIKNVA